MGQSLKTKGVVSDCPNPGAFYKLKKQKSL